MHSGLIRSLIHRSADRHRWLTRLPLILALLLTPVIAACGQDTPVPTTIPTDPSVSPTEEASDTLTSPIPTPIGELPDPEPGTGHVLGTLTSGDDGEPVAMATLFLGELLGEDDSVTGMGLEPDRAPHAETGTGGEFVFLDVPPGRYGLIWWRSHRESYALSAKDQESGEFLIVVVEEADVTDLGDVTVSPPQ